MKAFHITAMDFSPIVASVATLMAAGIAYAVFTTYRHRARIDALRKKGIVCFLHSISFMLTL